MARFPIRTLGDPVLNTAAQPVTQFDAALDDLVADMLETMYDAPGVGLAAPQIGISKRLFVADVGDGPFVMANPELVELSEDWEMDEGCLSVPGHFWPITRAGFARAVGVDTTGKPVEYEGDALMGRVLQHEVDHLNGTLLLERLDRRARKEALKEIREESLGLR